MNLLEHQAKALLRRAGLPTPDGRLINPGGLPDDLPLPTVIKSQVPTGGRGLAGGIAVVRQPAELTATIKRIMTTPIAGHLPQAVLAEPLLTIDRELYLCLTIDRVAGTIILLAQRRGGVDVESLPRDSFWQRPLTENPVDLHSIGRDLADYLNLPGLVEACQHLIDRLYRCFVDNDARLLEINPLILTADQTLVAADCKLILDDAAHFRHPDWPATPDAHQFVELDPQGNIATMANGAGLAMATVDAIAQEGWRPVNFLDIGGGADQGTIEAALQRLATYPRLKAIVINVFAGITRCDQVAQAIIAARASLASLPPLYIRLVGTNQAEAQAALAAANLPLYPTLPAALTALRETYDV